MKMKQTAIAIIFVTCLIFIFTTVTAEARSLTASTIKIGTLNPKDAKSGFILGFNHGMVIDERVDVGFSADLFRKTYKKDVQIASQEYAQGINEKTYQREMEFTTMVIPLMATIDLKMPLSNYRPSPFLYIHGGLGWEMMFNSEKNYVDNTKESRFYSGFGYMVGAGLLYELGSRSAIIAELGYNGCRVSRDQKKVEGLPVWDEVNISGLMLRIGIRLGIL
ncbi:hypothetical protein JW964_03490 [candidate division KSB1 bacterium]|nr:hypothetical protein [candidate division KSB1 bacterium]